MINWSQVRWYDRLGGVFVLFLQMIGIVVAVEFGLIVLFAVFLALEGPDDTRLPLAGLWSWSIAYIATFGRWRARRHFGDDDAAKTMLMGMGMSAPLALLTVWPLSSFAVFAGIYLASYVRPAIWLEIAQ